MGGNRCDHAPGTCTASAEYQAQIRPASNPDADLSRDWFLWAFDSAMREAVRQHGDPARMVAWTAREAFDATLSSDVFAYRPIRLAQGMAAQSGETEGLDRNGNSPVANGDAPKPRSEPSGEPGPQDRGEGE